MKTEHIVADPLALEIVWQDGQIVALHVRRSEGVAPTKGPSPQATALTKALARYVAGQDPRWPDLALDLDRMTPFRKKVMEILRAIPAGKTATYGEMAAMAGSPGAARAVGRVMATNPWTLIYPCHRVVGSGGAMTGFSAEGGVDLKRLLLELESR